MLEAAARLFAKQRFHEVRMEDIAAEAAVGKGTLYRYFKDKEELFLALLDRASQQILERLHEQLECTTGAQARLRAIVESIIAFFEEQPHLLDLIQREEVLHGPEFEWQQTRRAMMQMVQEVFHEGKDRGEFTVRDPDTAALVLLGGLRGVLRFGRRPRPRDLAQRIVDGLLQGYACEIGGNVALGTS